MELERRHFVSVELSGVNLDGLFIYISGGELNVGGVQLHCWGEGSFGD